MPEPYPDYPAVLADRLQPEDLALLVRILCEWTPDSETKVATAAGFCRRTVYNYRSGRSTPSRGDVVQLSRGVGLRLDVVDHWLLPSIVLQRELGTAGTAALDPQQQIYLLVQDLRLLLADPTLGLGAPAADPAVPGEARPTAAEREEALVLWSHLAACPEEDRPYLIETCEGFQRTALAELLCHESEEAASDCAERAAGLARLALQVARLAPGDPAEKARQEGYALLFGSNSTRAGGDLPPARAGYEQGLISWQEGAGSLANLSEWRVLDLEASLLRDEREFDRALLRLDEALGIAPDAAGRILLKVASVHEQKGDGEAALAALRQAEAYVDRQQEPRLYLILRFNLATALLSLNRHEDAADLLPEILPLADSLALGSYSLRVRWLSARIDAGRGRLLPALTELTAVSAKFAELKSPWDWALVTLDLAVVRLRLGELREVRHLALQLVQAFEAQGIHREAMAALSLFREAAEHEAATVDLAQRLADYLRKAQRDPDLAFEG